MRRIAALAVAGAVLTGACSAGTAGGGGPARVVPLGGLVEVRHDASWQPVTSPLELRSGDLVRSGDGGAARIMLPTGAAIEIGPDSSLRLDGPSRAEVLGGQALATGGPGRVALAVDNALVQPSGGSSSFRVDRSLSARVGVYNGAVDVSSAGRPVSVDALWQAVVAAGVVTQSPEPLTVSPSDPWDVRLLGQAIDMGDELSRLGRGVRSQLAGRGAPAPLLADAFPGGLSTGGVRGLLTEHGLDDVFLALAVASHAASLADAPVTGVAGEILSLRDLGASWAIVVATFGVLESPLLSLIGQVLAAIPRLFDLPGAPGGASGGTEPSAAPGGSSGGGGGGGGTSPAPGDPGGSTDPAPAAPTVEIPDPPAPPVNSCNGAQVGCIVEDILDGLLGGGG